MNKDNKTSGAGKGDKPRPRNVKSYDKGYDHIKWVEKQKVRK